MNTLLLVRHAVALGRSDWEGDDEVRPLDERGLCQAEALVDQLAGYGVARILSSPSLRCVQTVTPLARARGLAVEPADALAEGAAADAVRLVRDLRADAVLCSHGDVIPEVLDSLDAGGRVANAPRCRKGSTWVLVRRPDGALVGARYLAPPA